MSSPEKRRDMDIIKLMMHDFKVTMDNEDSAHDFTVEFNGPQNTLYANGHWQVQVRLPIEYPFKSPSIGFKNKIFHPNIDEESGSVCIDVLNQTWSPLYDLVNIFEMFLPQLLTYPNPSDPLNPRAASMMSQDSTLYEQTIKLYIQNFASLPNDDSKPNIDANSLDANSLESGDSFDQF